jgi:hypothetical protein
MYGKMARAPKMEERKKAVRLMGGKNPKRNEWIVR